MSSTFLTSLYHRIVPAPLPGFGKLRPAMTMAPASGTEGAGKMTSWLTSVEKTRTIQLSDHGTANSYITGTGDAPDTFSGQPQS